VLLLVVAVCVLLAPGVALAAPRSRVTFLGGTPSGLLGCSAHPDTDRLRVPAESTVTVLNRLGQRAELLVNGTDMGAVRAGQQIGLKMHSGPVRVMLVPGCQLTGVTAAVLIEVTGVPAGLPAYPEIPLVEGAAAPVAVELGSAQAADDPHFSGLLFLIAATLVVGVSVMAIRGKTSNRPTTIRSDRPARPRHARRPVDKFR
jgi:hypothetical protein